MEFTAKKIRDDPHSPVCVIYIFSVSIDVSHPLPASLSLCLSTCIPMLIHIYMYIHTYIYYFYISAPMWNISDYSMIIVHTDIDFCRRPDGSLCNVVGHLCARGMGSNTPAARDLNPPKTKQISRRFDVCPVASARCKYDAYVRSNHILGWDEITYPFLNFNGYAVAVWEWISNFIPHLTGCLITYPYWNWN